MYNMKINTPPSKVKDGCFVFPAKGISLDTKFKVKCEPKSFLDEDLPHQYIWEYFGNTYHPNGDKEWKSITYPSDGNTFISCFSFSDVTKHLNNPSVP